MMQNVKKLYRDQYGNTFHAKTVQDLRKQIGMGGSRVGKMYIDNVKDGKTYHVGYVIGGHWLTAYTPMYNPA